jgi:hypothetical protein
MDKKVYNSTNTPVYGGYHPNDIGYGWFGNFRIDSKKAIEFFNAVTMKTAPLVHSVNRGELIFRTSDGGFSMQAIRVRIGLTMVLKAWKNNNELAHADIQRSEVTLGKRNSVEEDTLVWLESSWNSLRDLIIQSGLQAITLPDFEDLVPDSETTEADAPPFFNDYFGTGSAASYEEPSCSSEYGDLPEFSTDG